MIYGIASYKRPECRTVQTLLEAGVNKDEILVSTQTQEDYKEYKQKLNCSVIYSEKDSAAGNRNTILDEVKSPVLLLDDDITGFETFCGGKWKKDTIEALKKITELFVEARNSKCCIFGVSANSNGIITRNRFEYDVNTLLQGTVVGILEDGIRFNDKWKMVEDYELCLRLMKHKKNILRANYICATKPKNGSNEGGLHDRYKNGELKYWLNALERAYPEFKPNKNQDGGSIIRCRKK